MTDLIGKTYYEFFAGIGLVRLGLEGERWSCIWANDIDEDKEMMYRLNFADAHEHFVRKDIWEVAPSNLPGPVFLATASFPCVDLSVAGRQCGLDGHESGTFRAFVRILQCLKLENRLPKLVMLENVLGFLTARKGADIAEALGHLSRLGYVLDVIMLDAVHFTPQSRPRVFLFGVTPDIAGEMMSLRDSDGILSMWDHAVYSSPALRPSAVRKVILDNSGIRWGAFHLPSPPSRSNTLRDIMEDVPVSSPLWWGPERKNRFSAQMSERDCRKLEGMMASSEPIYATAFRRVRTTGSMAELRTDGIAGCLRTPRGGSSKQIVVMACKAEFAVRLMTPREYARLQGVPDSFALHENANKALFGFGDAVCAPAIAWLAKNVLNGCYDAYASAAKNNCVAARANAEVIDEDRSSLLTPAL